MKSYVAWINQVKLSAGAYGHDMPGLKRPAGMPHGDDISRLNDLKVIENYTK